MCFSATVSFAASGAIGTVGVLTLKKVRKPSELPLASLPLLFAVQQFVEGVIWVSFGKTFIVSIMGYIYSFFSHILWPIIVPIAIFLVEPVPIRRKILKSFIFFGVLVALLNTYYIIAYPVTVQITNMSIDYVYTHIFPEFSIFFYVAAVSISALISSHKIIRWLGLAIGGSLIAAVIFFNATFISVWCFFSALLSVIIYWYFISPSRTRS